MGSSIAKDCVADICTRLRRVPGLSQKVFHIYSEDEIEDKTKGLSYPCVGVIYDGIRSVGDNGDTNKQGNSTVLTVSILYMFRQNTSSNVDPKDEAVTVLDAARGEIKGRAPGGHPWRFLIEAPLGGKKGVLVYLQRWSTPAQLV